MQDRRNQRGDAVPDLTTKLSRMIKRMMKRPLGYYSGVVQMTYLMPASVSVEPLSVVDLTMEEENLKLGLCGMRAEGSYSFLFRSWRCLSNMERSRKLLG